MKTTVLTVFVALAILFFTSCDDHRQWSIQPIEAPKAEADSVVQLKVAKYFASNPQAEHADTAVISQVRALFIHMKDSMAKTNVSEIALGYVYHQMEEYDCKIAIHGNTLTLTFNDKVLDNRGRSVGWFGEAKRKVETIQQPYIHIYNYTFEENGNVILIMGEDNSDPDVKETINVCGGITHFYQKIENGDDNRFDFNAEDSRLSVGSHYDKGMASSAVTYVVDDMRALNARLYGGSAPTGDPRVD